jgi:hypothetical protein
MIGADKPMLLLTAPGVFGVDDPDDPALRGDILVNFR